MKIRQTMTSVMHKRSTTLERSAINHLGLLFRSLMRFLIPDEFHSDLILELPADCMTDTIILQLFNINAAKRAKLIDNVDRNVYPDNFSLWMTIPRKATFCWNTHSSTSLKAYTRGNRIITLKVQYRIGLRCIFVFEYR